MTSIWTRYWQASLGLRGGLTLKEVQIFYKFASAPWKFFFHPKPFLSFYFSLHFCCSWGLSREFVRRRGKKTFFKAFCAGFRADIEMFGLSVYLWHWCCCTPAFPGILGRCAKFWDESLCLCPSSGWNQSLISPPAQQGPTTPSATNPQKRLPKPPQHRGRTKTEAKGGSVKPQNEL